ncbi:MAG: preprotein translocase subunit SecE [Candidatus Omnitrophota bacterium]|nr:preprotein translocase subunit SecE [Candidatus Omnitrophota bacterium]
MQIAENIRTFINEIVTEMKKVSWSNRKELVSSAWIVVGSVLVFTIVLGIFDFLFSKAISLILKQGF